MNTEVKTVTRDWPGWLVGQSAACLKCLICMTCKATLHPIVQLVLVLMHDARRSRRETG